MSWDGDTRCDLMTLADSRNPARQHTTRSEENYQIFKLANASRKRAQASSLPA